MSKNIVPESAYYEAISFHVDVEIEYIHKLSMLIFREFIEQYQADSPSLETVLINCATIFSANVSENIVFIDRD